jgi:hypothetical protein
MKNPAVSSGKKKRRIALPAAIILGELLQEFFLDSYGKTGIALNSLGRDLTVP